MELEAICLGKELIRNMDWKLHSEMRTEVVRISHKFP